jgi:Glycosyltransferase family 10 (fucosyltransferase) C-term/Fucosyltransferase, N-terminal
VVERRPSLILFYNRFFRRWPRTDTLDCAGACRFTTDRADLPIADAVVFHLPNCEEIWAAPKYPGQLWVAASMESATTCPDMADPEFMRAFDLTMTHRRDSDVWTPYRGVPAISRLSGPVPAKTGTAPAALFQSASYDPSGRYAYLAALMQHIGVDSYGAMLRNRVLDGPDLGVRTKLATIGCYKFYLGFENTIEPDYVTEKFFHALEAGAVPVYRGAPNIRDFAPGENSYIDVNDFAGPAELAAYLDRLDHDEAAYRQYHAWREQGVSEAFRRFFAATARQSLCRLCDQVQPRRDPATRRSGEPVRPLAWRQWLRLAEDGRHAPLSTGRHPMESDLDSNR